MRSLSMVNQELLLYKAENENEWLKTGEERTPAGTMNNGRCAANNGRSQVSSNYESALKMLYSIKQAMITNTIHIGKLVVIGVLVVIPQYAMCEVEGGKEDHSVVFQIGPSVERNLTNKSSNSGSTMAVEFTPIEDELEVEVGATLLNSSGQRELSGEVLFKKPYRLSPTSEFMIGIGPQVGHSYQGADSGNSYGLALAFDLMFWPSRNVGWYFSPEYGYGLGRNAGEHSIGASVGILFGL
jgi:hypothetical protein